MHQARLKLWHALAGQTARWMIQTKSVGVGIIAGSPERSEISWDSEILSPGIQAV